MKRLVTLFFVVAVLAAGSYYWWKISNPPIITAWDLVTDQAVAVYERTNPSTISDKEWLLGSLFPDSVLKTIRRSKELLASLHVIGKEEMGTVLYLPHSSLPQNDISLITAGHKYTERNFEGFRIIEARTKGKTISIASVTQTLVISSTSFLVEDVIRLAKAEEKRNFVRANRSLFQFTKMESEEGHIYLNLLQLSTFLDFFVTRKNQGPLLDRFARSGLADIKQQEHSLLFSGFAIDSLSGGPSILALFNQQRPVAVSLQPLISSRTGMLLNYGISDYKAWTSARLDFCKAMHSPVVDSLKALRDRHGFNADAFYESLGDEIGLCQGGVFTGDVLIVELKKSPPAITELNKLRSRNVDSQGEEGYNNYFIQALSQPQLTTSLFWPLSSHEMNYYLVTDHHLIFSEDLDDLKSFVDDIDSENTWGKSAEWNKFLSTSQETNVGVIFDGLNGWPSLRQLLTPRWQAFGDSTRFLNLNRGSLQFTRLEHSYYLNAYVEFHPKLSAAALEQREKVLELTLSQPLMRPLKVVRNHMTKGSELLAQDRESTLSLYSTKLKNLFKIKIDGPIRSDITQIDYYKNKKLQYLFATDKKIWLIDRLGKTVDGFPKTVSARNPIRYLAVVDFDTNANYRFLVSDKEGRMSMYDRSGRIVTDWKSADINNELWQGPRAVRSKGKDYVFAITWDGVVYGFTKKGETVPGFPVNLKLRPSGTWVIQKENDRDLINLVASDGTFIQMDFKGAIVNRSNLVKTSASSTFTMVATPEDHAVISRVDKGKIAVLDGKGENILFQQDNPGSADIFLNYFEPGREKRLFGFTDPQQEFTYFFNEKGKPIFSRPLENDLPPAITSDRSGNIYFYGVTKNKIQSYRPARNQ